MSRYVVKPVCCDDAYDVNDWDGETQGTNVYESDVWSKDRPTGILNPQGDMICRTARQIGYLADN